MARKIQRGLIFETGMGGMNPRVEARQREQGEVGRGQDEPTASVRERAREEARGVDS